MEEENNDFVDETFDDMDDALVLGDLTSGFISNPKVGESVTFTVRKIIKLTGKKAIGKTKDGETFSKCLSSVDYGFEITTTNGERFPVSSWEVFGKIKSVFQKLGKIEGSELKISHLLDGMKAENKKKDKYKVEAKVDGAWKTLDRDTKNWI